MKCPHCKHEGDDFVRDYETQLYICPKCLTEFDELDTEEEMEE